MTATATRVHRCLCTIYSDEDPDGYQCPVVVSHDQPYCEGCEDRHADAVQLYGWQVHP